MNIGRDLSIYHNKCENVIKISGFKKSCKICRQNVKNHFEKHLEFHLQCKFCLFQLASMEDEHFWKKVCNICGKVMSPYSLKKMNWHKKVHEVGDKFKCFLCDLNLKRKFTLKRHMKEKHNQEWKDDSIAARIMNGFMEPEEDHVEEGMSDISVQDNLTLNESFQCDQCAKVFRYKRNLERHIQYKHNQMDVFKCEECGVQYKNKCDLKYHKTNTHKVIEGTHTFAGQEFSKVYSCRICSINFKRKNLLTRHLATHFEAKEKLSCEHCGKKYGRDDTLRQHILVMHLDPEECPCCKVCGKKFQKKFNLMRHMKALHDM